MKTVSRAKKDYDRLKVMHRLFWVMYVFSILGTVIAAVRFAAGFFSLLLSGAWLVLASAALELAVYIALLRLYSALVRNQDAGRARAIAQAFLVLQALNIAVNLFVIVLCLLSGFFPGWDFFLSLAANVLLLLFSIELRRKVVGVSPLFGDSFRTFFILFIVLTCCCQATGLYAYLSAAMPDILRAVVSLIRFAFELTLYYFLYKAITNGWFYRRFLEKHPSRFFEHSSLRPRK